MTLVLDQIVRQALPEEEPALVAESPSDNWQPAGAA
jgi:hypothetical protein